MRWSKWAKFNEISPERSECMNDTTINCGRIQPL
jgi:hypothetical protein